MRPSTPRAEAESVTGRKRPLPSKAAPISMSTTTSPTSIVKTQTAIRSTPRAVRERIVPRAPAATGLTEAAVVAADVLAVAAEAGAVAVAGAEAGGGRGHQHSKV